jgi:hypothetical protein
MSDENSPADSADEVEDVRAAVVSDGAYTLLAADFTDTETAYQAH